ncbi:hypothetical protein FSARC_9652 [Fusarium sarcochroum]|uniref:Dioxygenase n=1 Tax=Fusarium sarcochroum TaxID=1208366 RepID=A0A8H4TQH4_9HYPO|nr:hypothetical protein FSARC_9652 [Fusarium sarcochroum]
MVSAQEATDPSYQPATAITALDASSPIGDILSTIERDGGVILRNFASLEDISGIDKDVESHRHQTVAASSGPLSVIPKETLAVPGLVGKSDIIAKIAAEHPVLENLRQAILQHTYRVNREKGLVEYKTIDPLLSMSVSFYIGPGAPRQRLHRDDLTHGVEHDSAFRLDRAGQFGCLIAASRTTRENGATMFIPGSHKWDDSRAPKIHEVCFAEMKPGSALIFLASCYHGGGHNSTTDQVRRVHGLFFCRGNMRTEENQFFAVPRSKLEGANDKMLSLLGYKIPSDVPLGMVDNADPSKNLTAVFKKADQ